MAIHFAILISTLLSLEVLTISRLSAFRKDRSCLLCCVLFFTATWKTNKWTTAMTLAAWAAFTKISHTAPKSTIVQMLLRWIDDYLLVTTDKRKAQSFLHTMNKGETWSTQATSANIAYVGHPEYGCFISKEKTLTNFWDDTHHPQTISPNATGTK